MKNHADALKCIKAYLLSYLVITKVTSMERKFLLNFKMLPNAIEEEKNWDATTVEKLDISPESVLSQEKVNIFLSRWRKKEALQKKSFTL